MTHSHSFDPREETPNAARQAAAQRSTWVSVGVNIALSITQMLVGLWAELNLPARCRAIWEAKFPELAEVSRPRAS